MLMLNFKYKNMKKISFLIFTISTILFTNCTKDFDTVNSDPNNPLSIRADLLMSGIIRGTQTAAYQMFGDNGATWSQQISQVEYVTEERYIPRNGSVNNTWGASYTTVIKEAKEMAKFAKEENNTKLEAAAIVLEVNAFQTLTDVFGPIPYTEACVKGNYKPKYDSQEFIYNDLIKRLDEAIALFSVLDDTKIPVKVDLIFAGDVSKWKKFAYSLKLRALMRISKAPGVNNASKIQEVVASGNLMSSNADTAKIYNLTDQANAHPFFATLGNRKEYKVSSVLVAKCNEYNDPRLAIYAEKNNANLFVGNNPGADTRNYPGTSAIGAFYKKADLSSILLSYSQVQLLLAEAANEGYIANPSVGGVSQAVQYMRNGIESNFIYNGLTSAAATTYVAQPSLIFITQAAGKKIIAEQVWLSTFCQGFEPWTEWRRTGFPTLVPVISATQPSIPSRYPYAQLESSVNQASYSAAVSTLGNGDTVISKLWWDVN